MSSVNNTTPIKSTNIHWSVSNVLSSNRATRNGHKGAVLWFTGLSGSGKSTIACCTEKKLFNAGYQVCILDGDNIRHGLNSNLGFSPQDREENIRRVSEVAALLAEFGFIVLTAFISPYTQDRLRARDIVTRGGHEFAEIYVETPLAVCEERDVKGLYKKARAGEIAQFTGISAPYEVPLNPQLTIHTDKLSVEESVASVVEYITPLVCIPMNDQVMI
jgi:adenylyl-sulfate kinase